MEPIASIKLDLSYTHNKMDVRIYKPEKSDESSEWACRFEVDAPISVQRTIYGDSSLQALVLAMKVMSSYVYGSDAYRNREIGIDGEFGGDLSIPAQHLFLDIAPFPF